MKYRSIIAFFREARGSETRLGHFMKVVDAFRVPGQGNHGGSQIAGFAATKLTTTTVMWCVEEPGSSQGAPGWPMAGNYFFSAKQEARGSIHDTFRGS